MSYDKKTLKVEFKKQLPTIEVDEPLAKYSTFQIGGPADFFYKLQNIEELPSLITFCDTFEVPYYILGGGSNTLFHDKGFRGLIIKLDNKNITINNDEITADSGVSVAGLINECLANNLTGLEQWTGLPGTVGGAVRGNAGCNGLEIKDVLVTATILEPSSGKIKLVDNNYFHFKYRYGKLKTNHAILLNATFKVKKNKGLPKNKEDQKKQIQALHKARMEKQPFGLSCGSFFKNPSPEKPAGQLIDQAGLKGTIIGKAQISEKHGNFFLNLGGATAEDILKLAHLVQTTIKSEFGLDLEPEVQIIPENPAIALARQTQI